MRRRVSAALNDAEAVVDAYAKARVAVADAAESAGAADAAASSRAREAAELRANAAKATARGAASDAAACLASIVAATAATAVAAKEGDVAATVAVQGERAGAGSCRDDVRIDRARSKPAAPIGSFVVYVTTEGRDSGDAESSRVSILL